MPITSNTTLATEVLEENASVIVLNLILKPLEPLWLYDYVFFSTAFSCVLVILQLAIVAVVVVAVVAAVKKLDIVREAQEAETPPGRIVLQRELRLVSGLHKPQEWCKKLTRSWRSRCKFNSSNQYLPTANEIGWTRLTAFTTLVMN